MVKLTVKSVFKSAGGMQLPVIGLGTWQSMEGDVERATQASLELGYPLIDTAFNYNNESIIGGVLAERFKSGKLKRQDIFITTKLPVQGNQPQLVKEFLEKSLKALQLNYVDLYLIHHPAGLMPGESLLTTDPSGPKLDPSTDHVALWKEMEKQVDAGRAKAIGLSNFNIRQIERVLSIARIPPANLQTELYLYNQCRDLQEFCKKKGITLTSYGTLGSSGAPMRLVQKDLSPLQDPVVVRIAQTHGKAPGQVLLRHLLQSGVAVIPKSSKRDRLQENIEVFDFELSDAEMKELNSLDQGENGRRFLVKMLMNHPEYPHPLPKDL